MAKGKLVGKPKEPDKEPGAEPDKGPDKSPPEPEKAQAISDQPLPEEKPKNGNGAPDPYAELKLAYDEQGFPCLSIAQLASFNEAMLTDDNSKLRLELARTKRQLWLEQQAPYRKLTDDINAASVEREGKKKAYIETMRRLSREIGVSLEGCIINDQTGRLTFVDTRDRPIVGAQKPPDHARLREET